MHLTQKPQIWKLYILLHLVSRTINFNGCTMLFQMGHWPNQLKAEKMSICFRLLQNDAQPASVGHAVSEWANSTDDELHEIITRCWLPDCRSSKVFVLQYFHPRSSVRIVVVRCHPVTPPASLVLSIFGLSTLASPTGRILIAPSWQLRIGGLYSNSDHSCFFNQYNVMLFHSLCAFFSNKDWIQWGRKVEIYMLLWYS